MDYEKKYNHALEVVRELQKDWASTQNRAAREIELAFPELRESEGERMRRCIGMALTDVDEQRFKDFGTTLKDCIAWLEKQKETPMPNSTELIEMWHKAKAILKEKDFRGDEWRLAQNAFMDGFARGTCVKFEKQKEQKPAWSEEDEKKIHFLSRLIEFQVRDGEYCFGEGSCAISKQEAIEMLQSLRPQSQKLEDWTEEDEKVYNNALDALYYKDVDDALSALKDLCDLISRKRKVIPPYSRWKPSDEQIKALGAAIVFHKNDPQIDIWRSLYDDLQKIR